MNRRTTFLLALILTVGGALTTYAQNRTIGAQRIVLDDGSGHTYTIQINGTLTGNVVYNVPVVPGGNPPAGFVNVGTAGQTLYWNGVNSDWEASSVITNNTNGNGTNVTITAPVMATSSSSIFGANTNSGTTLSVRNDGNSPGFVTGPVQVNAAGSQNGVTFNTTGSATNDIAGTANWSVSKTGAGAFNTLSVAGGKLNADVNGNLTKINNITYSFPAAQAAAVGAVLTNDAAGNLTWNTAGSNSAQVVSTNSTYTGGGSLGTNQNDLAINANSAYFKINATANVNVTGVNATGSADGRVVYFSNVGAGTFTVTFNNQSTNSAAADRFLLPGGFDVTIAPGSSAVFIYDATAQRWRLLANN